MEHDILLDKVLNRINESGLTVNPDKCCFGVEELEFFGLKFTRKGVKLTEDKVKALREAKSPRSVGELQSLLGLSTYCSRYIKDHAIIVEPLRKLLKKGTRWRWSKIEENALNNLKSSIMTDCLGYFNQKSKTELIVDASPVGLGAVLMQINPEDPTDRRIISFASKSLNDVERRYSHMEKEGYAAV
ncbi:unnamed protein product [Brachionus calyciflorus]|uniref:Reverse transcriptase/retrotransposon-derived protein RNase H-like domain-containing protein n=1 Tax=Brachionus calyciflorus TaxID=104777 RepID=A0A813XZR2_9BILA|nr:unnamed protein product [Brachionus calyciflorus]